MKYSDYQDIKPSSSLKFKLLSIHKQELEYNNTILTKNNNNKSEDEILQEFSQGGILMEQFCKNVAIYFEKIVLFVIIVYLCELLR